MSLSCLCLLMIAALPAGPGAVWATAEVFVSCAPYPPALLLCEVSAEGEGGFHWSIVGCWQQGADSLFWFPGTVGIGLAVDRSATLYASPIGTARGPSPVPPSGPPPLGNLAPTERLKTLGGYAAGRHEMDTGWKEVGRRERSLDGRNCVRIEQVRSRPALLSSDHAVAKRALWYDSGSDRLLRVDYFNDHGTKVGSLTLSDYAPVPGRDVCVPMQERLWLASGTLPVVKSTPADFGAAMPPLGWPTPERVVTRRYRFWHGVRVLKEVEVIDARSNVLLFRATLYNYHLAE